MKPKATKVKAHKVTKTSKLPAKPLRRLTTKEKRQGGIDTLIALFKALGYDAHLVTTEPRKAKPKRKRK